MLLKFTLSFWHFADLIAFFNSKGQVVLTDEIQKSSSEFDLADLPKGVYIVELQNGRNTSGTKIVLK